MSGSEYDDLTRVLTVCPRMFFFFSSRRRHTRCSRDWSSDVCSSDLHRARRREQRVRRVAPGAVRDGAGDARVEVAVLLREVGTERQVDVHGAGLDAREDRKSGVEGKRVDLGGRRIIKKKKRKKEWGL